MGGRIRKEMFDLFPEKNFLDIGEVVIFMKYILKFMEAKFLKCGGLYLSCFLFEENSLNTWGTGV